MIKKDDLVLAKATLFEKMEVEAGLKLSSVSLGILRNVPVLIKVW